MTTDEDVQDSPVDWVAKHIRTYVETDGKKGHIKWGVPTLLFNGYGEFVADLYKGLENERLYA